MKQILKNFGVDSRKLMMQTVRTALDLVGRVWPKAAGWVALRLLVRPKRRPSDLNQRIEGVSGSRLEGSSGNIQVYSWSGYPKVLLVHGWDSSSNDYLHLIRRLKEAGWGGVAFDAPAHGLSDGSETDFLRIGEAFRQVYDAYGPFQAVIGHSFGAAVAIYQLSYIDDQAPSSIIVGGSPSSLQQVFEIFSETLRLSQTVRDELNHRIESRLGKPMIQFDMGERIAKLPSQVLIIHDQVDRRVPYSAAKQLHHAANRSRLLSTSGLGHRKWLRNPDTIQSAYDFIKSSNRSEMDFHELDEVA